MKTTKEQREGWRISAEASNLKCPNGSDCWSDECRVVFRTLDLLDDLDEAEAAGFRRGQERMREQVAEHLAAEIERIKHTRHVDGLGMGWLAGEDLLKEQMTAVDALPLEDDRG